MLQGIYGENTVGLLGNFPSRIAGNAENSPIRQGASPFALPVEDCISPLSKIVRFIVLQAKKKVLIYIFTLENLRKAGVGKSPNQSFYVILQVKRKCPLKWHIKFKKEALCLSCSLKT